MKIYVICYQFFGNFDVICAFKSLEEAEKELNELMKPSLEFVQKHKEISNENNQILKDFINSNEKAIKKDNFAYNKKRLEMYDYIFENEKSFKEFSSVLLPFMNIDEIGSSLPKFKELPMKPIPYYAEKSLGIEEIELR